MLLAVKSRMHTILHMIPLRVHERRAATPTADTKRAARKCFFCLRYHRTYRETHVCKPRSSQTASENRHKHGVTCRAKEHNHKRTLASALHALKIQTLTEQEEGRTALSLALMEDREDIADLIISVEETDVNKVDVSVSSESALFLWTAKIFRFRSTSRRYQTFRGLDLLYERFCKQGSGETPLPKGCVRSCTVSRQTCSIKRVVRNFKASIDSERESAYTSTSG